MTGKKVIAYKGFDQNMQCRGFQYEVGGTYKHDGPIRICGSGFHACIDPLHVLRHYPAGTSKFAVVEAAGQIDESTDSDTKIASSELTISASIDLPGIIRAAIEYRTKKAKPVKGSVTRANNKAATASGRSGAATASGWYGAATASGRYGAATASGRSGAATASGESGAATASGESGAATASGRYGAATASGESGAATASGRYGAATASGWSGAATASGWSGAATASGESGAATASGRYGAATASGWSGAATASGRSGAATADHSTAVACASGYSARVKGVAGSAIFSVYRNLDDEIVHAKSAIVGRDGIDPDTWYRVTADGQWEAA